MDNDPRPTEPPGDPTASLAHLPTTTGGPWRIPADTMVAGRYRVLRCIGAGGMGEVYEAEDRQLERIVALKVVGPVEGDAEAALSEARKAARLRHPCIATVFDAGIEQIRGVRAAYLAMELVPGAERIDTWANRTGADLARAAAVLAQVCDAMAHAHALGVVHGDLKPTNILVDADGSPRVIDFGVARVLGVAESLQASRGGTPGYSAPEQEHRNAPTLDGRADVYSLGVIAREILGPRVPPGAAARDLELIAREATHADRTARVATTEELGENLRALGADRPLPIARRDAGYMIRSSARRFARGAPLAWIAACALIGTAFAWFVAVPMVHDWTPINRLATDAFALLPRLNVPGAPLEDVRVILLEDQDDLDALAAREGLEGVRSDNVQSWRRMHGRLMEKLAQAGPSAVVWDIIFASPSEFDADLIAGMRAVEATGAGVVVAARDWTIDAAGLPEVDRTVLKTAGWGVTTGVHNATEPWRIDLLVDRGDASGVTPSLAVRAIAATVGPDVEVQINVARDSGTARLRFWKPVPGIASGRARVDHERAVFLSALEKPSPQNASLGLRAEERVGVLVVRVPDDATLARASIGYTEALTLPPAELRARISGKVVVIGNVRGNRDIWPHPDGRRLPGPWAHACAIDALHRGGAVRYIDPAGDTLAMAAFALVGSIAGFVGRGGWVARFTFLACLAMGSALIAAGLYAGAGFVVNTAVQAGGAIASWECGAIGARLRRG